MSGCPVQGGRFTPPKPRGRKSKAWGALKLILGRGNIFAALNEKLYRGWLGRSNILGHRAAVVNQPDLVRRVLIERPMDFPKSPVMARALAPLLGDSVFLTNGETWRRQRRMIDPAFEGGKVRGVFPVMRDCAEDMVARLREKADGRTITIDGEMTHVTADVIFRALFSIPIARQDAYAIYEAFQRYQAAAPFVSLRTVIGAPSLRPRWWPTKVDRAGADIRRLLLAFIEERRREIAAGTAPDDLATGILTTADPETGHRFDAVEMLDQVATFFLAGHETSASALSWALYLIAQDAEIQARMRAEAQAAFGGRTPAFSDLKALSLTRDVFREALRLYPPVPFAIRRTKHAERMRDTDMPPGSTVILSPWHLHRHQKLWDDPDVFDPDRWKTENGRARARDAYIPFLTGARVCPGAAFAMQESALILARLVEAFELTPEPDHTPSPVMQVTLRAGGGVRLRLTPAPRPPRGAAGALDAATGAD